MITTAMIFIVTASIIEALWVTYILMGVLCERKETN